MYSNELLDLIEQSLRLNEETNALETNTLHVLYRMYNIAIYQANNNTPVDNQKLIDIVRSIHTYLLEKKRNYRAPATVVRQYPELRQPEPVYTKQPLISEKSPTKLYYKPLYIYVSQDPAVAPQADLYATPKAEVYKDFVLNKQLLTPNMAAQYTCNLEDLVCALIGKELFQYVYPTIRYHPLDARKLYTTLKLYDAYEEYEFCKLFRNNKDPSIAPAAAGYSTVSPEITIQQAEKVRSGQYDKHITSSPPQILQKVSCTSPEVIENTQLDETVAVYVYVAKKHGDGPNDRDAGLLLSGQNIHKYSDMAEEYTIRLDGDNLYTLTYIIVETEQYYLRERLNRERELKKQSPNKPHLHTSMSSNQKAKPPPQKPVSQYLTRYVRKYSDASKVSAQPYKYSTLLADSLDDKVIDALEERKRADMQSLDFGRYGMSPVYYYDSVVLPRKEYSAAGGKLDEMLRVLEEDSSLLNSQSHNFAYERRQSKIPKLD